MRYVIEHETALSFPKSVREHQCELRLAPRESDTQHRVACEIEVDPDAKLRTHLDAFGNLVHRLSLLAPHDGLRARVSAEVETTLENPFDYVELAPADERAWQERALREDPSLYDFVLHRSLAIPDLAGGQVAGCEIPRYAPERTLLANAQAAMAWAGETFVYESGATEVHGALSEFFEQRAGVCQDFAHLMVALVRSWGFASRYAMGYVDPGVTETQEAVQATHAWAEVMIPGAGWRGFDATSGLVTTGAYIPVAMGRESRDAAPVRGTFKGEDGGTAPRVSVRVTRREAQEQQVQ